MNPSNDISPYGRLLGSGAASIDVVVKDIPIGQVFTLIEIEQEVRRRGLPTRGAIRRHLDKLVEEEHICRAEGGWQRLN